MVFKRCGYILSIILFSLAASNTFADNKPYVERNTQLFLDHTAASKKPPIETLSPTAARELVSQSLSGVKVTMPKVTIAKKTITVDGKPLELTIVRPEQQIQENPPVFMFFHGGGWVLGDFANHQRLVSELVNRSGAVAVFVNYSLSPEVHYPVAINQAYAATKWVAKHDKEIGVDGKRLAVVGTSAGGNMAAVVSLMAKDKGTPEIKYQVLFWPVTDANFNTASYNEFATGYFLTKNMMKWFWDNYIPDEKQRSEIYASPLQATVLQLHGLPSALVITAADDVLRDEGEAYAAKMDAAGVDVVSVRYNGMIHDFATLDMFNQLPSTLSVIAQVGLELKEHLK